MTSHFKFDETNTFCISLPDSPRWPRMSARLETIGLSATRWPACHLPEHIVDPFPEYLSLQQKGCAQSHLNIYKHILATGLQYALVLEDDAMFDPWWRNKLAMFSCTDVAVYGLWDALFLNASEPAHPHFEWVQATEQYLTAGYIISRRGVERIMEMHCDTGTRLYFASDWMTTRLQLMSGCYTFFPWLIVQEGQDTNIGDHLEADHQKVVDCLATVGMTMDGYI